MIKVIYELDDNNNYCYLNVKGHAEYADYGKDIVCSSVSSIIFGLLNALDELKKNIVINIITNDIITNDIEIIINESNEKINNYLELTMMQLKSIEYTHSENIKIERKA